MTNQQFRKYIDDKVQALKQELGSLETAPDRAKEIKAQLDLIKPGLRIMTYGTGEARRRFRRNYERSLLRQGKRLEDLV